MDQHSPKRKRLSYACNHCRQKKTRCDEQQPSCRNCRIAGVECITTDKRRSGIVVSHRRRARTGTSPSASPAVVATPESRPSPLPPTSQYHPPLPAQSWDRSGWGSGRLPMMPQLVGGSMFAIMTEWLDLAFFRLRIPAPYAPASPPIPNVVVPNEPARLPTPEAMRRYQQLYFDTLHYLFPFLSVADLEGAEDFDVVKPPSGQALAYLIATIGCMADPQSHLSGPTISSYISQCNGLLGHMVAERSLHSVQAILLLAIALRSCDEISWAWDVLSLGVSIAQSIRINQPGKAPFTNLGASSYSTWWCMYVFEKVLAFECGRASNIWDRDLSQPARMDEDDMLNGGDLSYQRICIGLANTLHEMQDRAAGTWRREEWLPQTVEEAIEEKIRVGGELAMLLNSWWKDVPSEYRLAPRLGSASPSDRPRAQRSAFLSFYYSHAFILLNRSSLLVEGREMSDVLERYALWKPWHHLIANGATTCVEAARESIKLIVALVDSGQPSFLTSMVSPLGAVYILAVHIFRERHSLLIRSDFELMKVGIAITRQHYRRFEASQRVEDILSAVEAYAAKCLEGQAPEPFAGDHDFGIPLDDSPSNIAGYGWGPSGLDWAGWDWNDLSHLFEHGE
ncbi:hypothetical protein BJY01DRAFT_254230 [Aspergillus pseudoustus]|uniref:Zn(2)-C6 fungal-type domain-containing protein n=1 Tax=Aspergillus pseudoustus TaxID=1810923 RepID=A0ABR4IV20_9EURO